MNSRWLTLVSLSLLAFAFFVMAWQFRHWKAVDFTSIAVSCVRAEHLPKVSHIPDREGCVSAGECRFLDLVLPKDARVFMPDMTGPTNHGKMGYYYFATYYLFPREIGVSVDQPARISPGEVFRR